MEHSARLIEKGTPESLCWIAAGVPAGVLMRVVETLGAGLAAVELILVIVAYGATLVNLSRTEYCYCCCCSLPPTKTPVKINLSNGLTEDVSRRSASVIVCAFKSTSVLWLNARDWRREANSEARKLVGQNTN